MKAGRLKEIRRTGWVTKAGIGDAESVADHSFRVGLAALLLSDLTGLDTLKAVRMALIHDLAESTIGDLTPEQMKDCASKLAVEDEAMEHILKCLPEEIRALYTDAWKEWVRGESREAKVVHELDAFEMALQAEEYARRGFDKDKLLEFKKYASARIGNGVVRILLNLLG